MDMEWIKPGVLLGSLVYALLGVIIFWLCFIIIDKITPYNLWEEIVEKQNQALASASLWRPQFIENFIENMGCSPCQTSVACYKK